VPVADPVSDPVVETCLDGLPMIRLQCGARRATGIGLVCLTVVVVTACAQPPPPARTLVLSVSNELGRTINEIQRKACEDPDTAFVPIEESRLAAGETRGFVLPPSCVDLVAFDARGRIVGEQRGLTMLPGASWVLRR
jgi:hypothetical protein